MRIAKLFFIIYIQHNFKYIIIKTKYNLLIGLRMLALNLYMFKYGPMRAFNYTAGVLKAKTIGSRFSKQVSPPTESSSGDEKSFDVFSLHISAYQKYQLTPYDGNIVVFRASDITFYMDDFKYLG